MKFCFQLGKLAAKNIVIFKTAYGDPGLSKIRAYEMFLRFKNKEILVQDPVQDVKM